MSSSSSVGGRLRGFGGEVVASLLFSWLFLAVAPARFGAHPPLQADPFHLAQVQRRLFSGFVFGFARTHIGTLCE